MPHYTHHAAHTRAAPLGTRLINLRRRPVAVHRVAPHLIRSTSAARVAPRTRPVGCRAPSSNEARRRRQPS
jgi:hypothetical protein